MVEAARTTSAQGARWSRRRLRRLVVVTVVLTGLGALLTPSLGSTENSLSGVREPSPQATPAVPAAVRSPPIIGTNDAAGWGSKAARTILRAHITWNRVELGSRYNTLASSLSDGFKVLAIVGNVDDDTPLYTVAPGAWAAGVVAELRTNTGIAIAEAANESYLKGGVADPVQYGRMYLAAIEAMRFAGIHVPLLFDMTGDIPLGSWADAGGWSQDAGGGGWLRDAVNGVPGLAGAILANGVSVHPYGAVGENDRDDSGIAAVAADEAVADAALGAVPPFYVTEIGFDLGDCGAALGACSEGEQASKLRAAYNALLADPHVAGIWWYQSHDDGTGRWGYMNSDGTTRPAFTTLSAIAASVGR